MRETKGIGDGVTDEFKELQSVVREFCDGHLKSCAHTTVEMPEGQGKQHLLVEIMKRIMALEEKEPKVMV